VDFAVHTYEGGSSVDAVFFCEVEVAFNFFLSFFALVIGGVSAFILLPAFFVAN
jgi:hypothetical protein